LDRSESTGIRCNYGLNELPWHQELSSECVGLLFKGILGNVAGPRKVLAVAENSEGMVGDEVVAEFMSHGKILEPFIRNSPRVTDAEAVTELHEKARNIWLLRAKRLDKNIELLCKLLLPDRQMHPVMLDQFFPSQSLNLEQPQASDQPEPPFFRSSRSLSISAIISS